MKPLKVFVIQPFNAPHSAQFKKAVFDVCEESMGQFESFRADEQYSGFSRLQDRIDSYIKGADICVADLGGTRNENALLEVGAAYTLGIPVIPVSDKPLPTDIRGNLWIEFKWNKNAKSKIESLHRDLRRRLYEATEEIGKRYSDQFVARGYYTRRNVDFFSLVDRCQKRISILTTNLGFVVNEKLPVVAEKIRIAVGDKDRPSAARREMSMLEMISQVIEKKPRNFTIKILALDPDSNFTNDRATALDRSKGEFRDAMRKDLETLIEFAKSDACTRSLEIKLYDESPLQMTYFFDDELIASVVAKGISSRECVTYGHNLLVYGAKETYERHFDHLWGAATLVARGYKKRENGLTIPLKKTRKASQ